MEAVSHLKDRRSILFGVVLFLSLELFLIAKAYAVDAEPDPGAELRRQQEREEQLRRQNTPRPNVRLQPEFKELDTSRLPENESPCFDIDKIFLHSFDKYGDVTEEHPFNWAVEAANFTIDQKLDVATGRCLGAKSVNAIMTRIQNAIIDKGYVTTRVLAGPQDLRTGELVLTVVPGLIREVRFKDSPAGTNSWNALPKNADQLLYLRDIEQGLENFKRVPSAEADIKIYPSTASDASPGDSDLVIEWQQQSPFRMNLSLDNAGAENTGKYQGTATFFYDNPLSLNDLFYVSLNNDLGGGMSGPRGTRGNNLHYSIPYGYWLLGLTLGRSKYHQTIAGANEDYVYSGESDNAEIKLSHMIYRDAKRKTQWYGAGWVRSSKNFIDGTEVEVQRRRTAGWELGLSHEEYIQRGTLQLDLSYRRGTGAMGALQAPEEAFDEGTSRPGIIEIDLSFSTPFMLLDRPFQYQGDFQAQWNQTPLVPQDRFFIGSRYTVRGFDGESSLSGDRGWLIRNEVATPLGQSNQMGYLGIDYGSVAGRSSESLVGKQLAGIALGLRGRVVGVTYDAYLATALKQPDGFLSDDTVFNFSLNWGF